MRRKRWSSCTKNDEGDLILIHFVKWNVKEKFFDLFCLTRVGRVKTADHSEPTKGSAWKDHPQRGAHREVVNKQDMCYPHDTQSSSRITKTFSVRHVSHDFKGLNVASKWLIIWTDYHSLFTHSLKGCMFPVNSSEETGTSWQFLWRLVAETLCHLYILLLRQNRFSTWDTYFSSLCKSTAKSEVRALRLKSELWLIVQNMTCPLDALGWRLSAWAALLSFSL